MEPFRYPSVNLSRTEIRILRPLHQHQEAHDSIENQNNDITVVPDLSMKFELLTVSLDENPVFTALSYVWGDPAGVKPITVNGQCFMITANLGSALRHFQYKDITPAVWIDSICINQKDNIEKAEQVGRSQVMF